MTKGQFFILLLFVSTLFFGQTIPADNFNGTWSFNYSKHFVFAKSYQLHDSKNLKLNVNPDGTLFRQNKDSIFKTNRWTKEGKTLFVWTSDSTKIIYEIIKLTSTHLVLFLNERPKKPYRVYEHWDKVK